MSTGSASLSFQGHMNWRELNKSVSANPVARSGGLGLNFHRDWAGATRKRVGNSPFFLGRLMRVILLRPTCQTSERPGDAERHRRHSSNSGPWAPYLRLGPLG